MVSKLDMLDSIGKVIDSKVGLNSLSNSFGLLMVSKAAERSTPTAQLPLPHMSERFLKMCERAVSVEKPDLNADWKEERLEDAVIWGRILDRMSLSVLTW